MSKARITKMGTKKGEPHYGLECIGCPAFYGHAAVIRVAHITKEAAKEIYAAHLANNHDATLEGTRF